MNWETVSKSILPLGRLPGKFIRENPFYVGNRLKFTNLTPLEKNGLAQLPLPATPQLMDSATLSAHFEKFTNLTPLEIMDSPNFPYLPPLN
jgi:hypothetical protein